MDYFESILRNKHKTINILNFVLTNKVKNSNFKSVYLDINLV